MHLFLQSMEAEHLTSRHPHEKTFVWGDLVAKLLRAPVPTSPQGWETDGTPRWRHFHWLEAHEIPEGVGEVEEGHWLLAVREHVDGRTLREAWLKESEARAIALRLTYRVRDLHEMGLVHGDLQPSNVVLDAGQDPWLIDLPVLATQPGDAEHVAGSAPLMAPELWEGSAPHTGSDVYALGCLVTWLLSGHYPHTANDVAGWAVAHRNGEPDLDGLPSPMSGVITRMLAREPELRPEVQELADALVALGASAPFPPMAAGGITTVDLGDASTHTVLVGPRGSGKSTALRAAVARWVIPSVDVIVMSANRCVSALVAGEGTGPWSSVEALVRAVGELRGEASEPPSLRGGDRLHVFEQLTEYTLRALEGRPVCIAWDDFGSVRPDTRAWWNHFVETCRRRDAPVRTLVASEAAWNGPGDVVEIEPLDRGIWNRWRATTARAEVRTIAQARWKQLVAEHGATVGGMLRSLDRELETEAARRERPDWSTDKLRAVQSDWRERVEELSRQCAFSEVIETCEGLHRSLLSRGKGDPETYHDLLAAWTKAAISTGGVEAARSLEEALSAHDGPLVAILHARLLNALGRHAEGTELLANVRSDSSSVEAEIECWRAQLALSSGRMEDAESHARRGLDLDPTPDVSNHLALLAHAPSAIRGVDEALRALESLAAEFETRNAPALLRARLHAYRAIGLGRADRLDEATDAHLRALEQVELGGLSAELPTYLLNAGTAYHRQGRLGLAREYYARGLRVAQSSTRASTRALLLANQANIDLALGRLDEADDLVRRALDVARQAGLGSIEAMGRSVEADVLLARGEADRARASYVGILEDPSLRLSGAQQVEIRLSLVEAALQTGDLGEAGRLLAEARRLIDEHDLDDLEHHHGILRARLQWAEGGELETMAGIELFRRHLLAAEEAGNHRLVLQQAPYLTAALRREQLSELLAETGELAQRSRNAVATGLGRDLRRDFFAQLPDLGSIAAAVPSPASTPPTSPVPPSPSTSPAPRRGGADVEPFYRMLSLNEVILHSDDLGEMLHDGLDIAMSLSAAERAFVLLRDEQSRVGDFAVAASRDVDGDPIPKPHLEVSLTIAEEAARTGRTVVTLNASQDQRFSQALSVVDLDLTSVLCVPVRDASGLLGALYLDHRFRPGVFEGEVPRMMEAFGHQLALAITNARRLEELRTERARLAQTQEKLAELLAERETELESLERRCAELSDQVERGVSGSLRGKFPKIAFGSREMEKVLAQVERVARGDIPVVVNGESGVGKELVAQAIHEASPRREGPFVAFNCGAVSENLMESEMFGHVKGAFTGADLDRQGLFMAAHGGTIFLDEVGEMPMSMQVKLLRVLQERQVRRVGETKSRPVDVRVVAATNRDLAVMVERKKFREDLYYRLAAFVIEIPPLRDRRDDIPLIAASLLERIGTEAGREVRLAPDGARLLRQCEWPGNVRELENTLRAAAVLTESEEIGEEQLAPLVRVRSVPGRPSSPTKRTETRGRRRKANREDVVEAMRRAGDDRTKAAEILGVSERTLYRYLSRWDLY